MNCENCGQKLRSDGVCTWCHEEIIIEEQYLEENEYPPEKIRKKAQEQRRDVQKMNMMTMIILKEYHKNQ
jgi:predicted ATP-dependent serine protease